MKTKASGFTLIEIAIVLVIIGLLLGGVLKGQELITGARVRNLISQQDGIKAAFFGFQDRYRALPGDYASAASNINCGGRHALMATATAASKPRPRRAGIYEDLLAWSHLTAAGFLNGSYTPAAASPPRLTTTRRRIPTASTCRSSTTASTATAPPPRPTGKHNLKTGGQIPVEIIAEVDRKIDDGKPTSGAFQFSTYAPAELRQPRPLATAYPRPREAWKFGRRGTPTAALRACYETRRLRASVHVSCSSSPTVPFQRQPRKESYEMMRKSDGFTLIEIAIVLVIIGLLLGGVLKGQELITGARVRNLISQQDGVKAAFFGFQDRYRALPGDYASADTNINCGAGLLQWQRQRPHRSRANGAGVYEDSWRGTHLTAAGFLNGSYAASSGVSAPTDANTPKNPYSVYMQIVYDGSLRHRHDRHATQPSTT